MHRFGRCFTGCALQRTKRFVVPSVGGATKLGKFMAEIFQNAKIGGIVVPAQILYIVTIYFLI